jgi:hypothetical protein
MRYFASRPKAGPPTSRHGRLVLKLARGVAIIGQLKGEDGVHFGGKG